MTNTMKFQFETEGAIPTPKSVGNDVFKALIWTTIALAPILAIGIAALSIKFLHHASPAGGGG